MAHRPRLRIVQAVSAGGVVYRQRRGTIEVLLLETPGGQWGLPKGTPGPEEALEETALREVAEETGLEVALEDKLGTIEYWFVRSEEALRFHKSVHFWLMRPTGGSLEQHDAEHVSVCWFSIADAVQRATHENTASILRQAVALIERADGQAAGAAR